jgi:hypothetical protein
MKDETMLAEQLRALLEAHGPATLLRAMSATALGLAEKATDDDDEWINLAAATAQAAEALTDDDQAAVDDAVGEEGDDEEEGEAEPSEAVDSDTTTSPPSAPSSRSNEGAAMRDQEFAPRKDATHWRAYRHSEDGKKSIPLFWGDDGVERSQWARKDFSTETIRNRWGVGRYVIWWYGTSEEGKLVSLGRGHELRIVERPSEAREPEPQRAAPEASSTASNGSADLLAALAAMRPASAAAAPPGSGGGGMDPTVMLQLFAFMADQQNKQARLADDRLAAERAIMMERERLAAKERIAQIEATAQIQARGRGGSIDHDALAEAIGRKVQEALAPEDDDEEGSTALAPNPTDFAMMLNAAKETFGPVLAAFATKIMSDATTLPHPYKPRGGNGNGSN